MLDEPCAMDPQTHSQTIRWTPKPEDILGVTQKCFHGLKILKFRANL